MIRTRADFNIHRGFLLKNGVLSPAVVFKNNHSISGGGKLVEWNPVMYFSTPGRYLDDPEDCVVYWPESEEIIAVPPQSSDHQGNAIGCTIVESDKLPLGWSNAADCSKNKNGFAFCCHWPDGNGGWDFIDNLKPVDPAKERQTAFERINAAFDIDATTDQKRQMLKSAISLIGDDALAEELVDHVRKQAREPTPANNGSADTATTKEENNNTENAPSQSSRTDS